jgi:beta-N-acetylhexosaminidase
MASLSVRQKAAQLVMVPFYGESPNTRSKAYREYANLIANLQVGGMIILNRVQNGSVLKAEPFAMAAFLNRMQRLARIPLIVGGDFERGASMRMTGTPQYPHAMAFGAAGDIEATRALGRATAREARAMGVHWVFAPDADVNNNPDNPIINIRSFGEDPALVSRHVRAFIEGAKSDPAWPVLVTAKHFPGHGDTNTDTHIGLGVIPADRPRLDAVELAPFREAIAAGVDSVMTGHLSVPTLEPDPIPATVSAKIQTALLRDELQFQGLVTTDAMDMQGLTKLFPAGEASVRAFESGADLLLVTPNPRETVRAIAAAVQSGRIPRERLDRSVERILLAKARLELHRRKITDLESIEDHLDTPEDQELAQSAASKAVTLVRNEGAIVPLRNPTTACYLVMSGARGSGTGRQFIESLREKAPWARTFHLDPLLPESELTTVANSLQKCETIVAAVYVASAAYRGNVALGGNYPAFLDQVFALGKPVVFIALGNPYLLKFYPNSAAYLATFSTVSTAEIAAVRALLGDAAISGKLPVTIPGQAERGAGLVVTPTR